MRTARGIIALNNCADLVHGLLRALALTDENTRAVVARMHRRTRDNEIAHAGKTRKRFLAPAHALGKAGDLAQRTCDEQRARIVAHAAAIADAAAQRRHVLERARQLHTDGIVMCVDAEDFVHERALHGFSTRLIDRRGHAACRQAARDLFCV